MKKRRHTYVRQRLTGDIITLTCSLRAEKPDLIRLPYTTNGAPETMLPVQSQADIPEENGRSRGVLSHGVIIAMKRGRGGRATNC